MKYFIYIITILTLSIFACEKVPEIEINITSPKNGTTVSGEVEVSCEVINGNKEIKKLELFINYVENPEIQSTNQFSISSPWSFNWNTTIFPDGEADIYIGAYDNDSIFLNSPSITIIIDNSELLPTIPILDPIIFQNESFYLNWSPNFDLDFNSYDLFESDSSNMVNQINIYSSSQSIDTSFIINNTSNIVKYYQIVTTDTSGYQSKSTIQRGNGYIVFVETLPKNSANPEFARSVQQIEDGGYILAGAPLLIKTNSNGLVETTKSYFENYNDDAYSVRQTEDGGFIVSGSLYIQDDTLETEHDVTLAKLDNDLNIEWIKSWDYNHENTEIGYSAKETNDGGFILVGTIGTTSAKVLIKKTNYLGEDEWTFMTSDSMIARCFDIIETSDGGFVAIGESKNTESSNYNIFLIKVNSSGNQLWSQTFGSNNADDSGRSIKQIDDGCFIIIGWTTSNNIYGYKDYWLIKTDSQGNYIWDKVYGYSNDSVLGSGPYSEASDIAQTQDGGYIIVGSQDKDGELYDEYNYNIWLVKTDDQGELKWSKTYGGNNIEMGLSIDLTSDGGYIISGSTKKDNFAKSIWLIKTDPDGNTINY